MSDKPQELFCCGSPMRAHKATWARVPRADKSAIHRHFTTWACDGCGREVSVTESEEEIKPSVPMTPTPAPSPPAKKP